MSRRSSLLVAGGTLLAIPAIVLFLRLPALPQAVIDWDESVYLLMARSMLQGHVPYTAVWDHKPPGLYALFALAQLLFGQSILAIRILALAVVTVSCWLLLLYGRRALGSWAIGALAALFYAVFSLQNGGLATNSEILLAPFTIGAFLLLSVRGGVPAAIWPGRVVSFLVIGLLLGVAIQIKAVAAAELLALLALVGVTPWTSRRLGQPARGRAALAAAGLVTGGALLPLLAVAAYFAVSGHFSDYYYANVTANLIYARSAQFSWTALSQALVAQARGGLLLWTGAAAAGALAWLVRRRHTRITLDLAALGVWLAFVLVAVLASQRIYWHYFLQALPPLSLLAAAGIVHAARLDSALSRARQALLIAMVLALGLAAPLAGAVRRSLDEAAALLQRTPRVDVSVYTAAYLRERMAPDDYLYVADAGPILYYLTGARIPTKYVLPAFLNRPEVAAMTGADPLAELERIMALRPRYVVLVEEYLHDPAFLAALQVHLARDYVLEQTIEGQLLYRLRS